MLKNSEVKKVSIQIVTFNSLKFLPECLKSIFNQTFKDFFVLIIDNASNDETVKYLEDNFPQIKIIKNSKNLGFAKAHNQGISISKSEYILIMNPDVILEKDFLEKLVKEAEKDKKIGSLGGKLLKFKFDNNCPIKTNIIDSAGLKILKSREVINRGEGEIDNGQYDKKEEVFGISGACVLFRREALEDVKVPIYKKEKNLFFEYFDQDFFAYKEDVDLAWRLRLFGYKSIYLPEAKAYHFRKISVNKKFKKPALINFLSYRNHLWMLLKNESFKNLFLNFFPIFWYQLKKEIYLLFTQPLVLLYGIISFWKVFFKMLQKRRYILKKAKVKPEEILK
jgi:GT2 family glycosyltransferase